MRKDEDVVDGQRGAAVFPGPVFIVKPCKTIVSRINIHCLHLAPLLFLLDKPVVLFQNLAQSIARQRDDLVIVAAATSALMIASSTACTVASNKGFIFIIVPSPF
jgi:hypothetical protein